MRRIGPLVFVLAVCAGSAAFAQPAHISCPPGQAAMRAIGPDGKLMTWCYPAGPGPSDIAHSPPVRGYIQNCTQDSDCPGPDRCENGGFCGRTNIWCNADSDCKYSEFCDESQQDSAGHFLGRCAIGWMRIRAR